MCLLPGTVQIQTVMADAAIGEGTPWARDLGLERAKREDVVERIMAVLSRARPGSAVRLRGSLAAGTADVLSDIDLRWAVPDDAVAPAMAVLGEALSRVDRVVSLRWDPSHARSHRLRLVFARMASLPLFWRIDLEVAMASADGDDGHHVETPLARSEQGWSRAASAIENAVAAIKATLRHQPPVADGLLQRGYDRVGRRPDPDASPIEAAVGLAQVCAADEPGLHDLAREIRRVGALVGKAVP